MAAIAVAADDAGAPLKERLAYYLQREDYVAVQGIITFTGMVVVVVSLFIDILAAWVDPRMRY